MKLSKAALMCIRGNPEVRQYIISYYAVSRQTLYKWIDNNDPRLADRSILTLLAQVTGLDEFNLLS